MWARLVLPAAVALVAFLPFLRGALSGASLYFRDLGQHFLPLRLFALEGLRRGEVRLWNPLVHEGEPLSLPAVGYPLDLLQLLRPDDAGVSLLLALHVPAAALGFLAMARGLGIRPVAAAGGALVYALGGFLLSTVNFYVHLQAAAWAPLLVLALAGEWPRGNARRAGLVAVALALTLSTTGIEIALQALDVGLALGWRRLAGPGLARRLSALVAGGALGLMLVAPVLVLVASQVEGSARGRGLSPEVVLSHSVHPFTLLQAVAAGLYGNPANLANEWWGQNFFPRGFPYILSLYLGAGALSLAAVGAASGRRPGRTAALLAGAALVVSLGRWAGLGPAVEALPALRLLRFPVKAWFTVHLAVSLLAALGLAALVEAGSREHWRRLAAIAGAAGAALAALPALPLAAPRALSAFAARFFPPGTGAAERAAMLERVLSDAAMGGLAALGLGAAAVLVLRGRLAPSRAALLAAGLVAADLLRAGAGLNPMVSPSFFRPSPELAALLPRLREGRVFTCAVEDAPAYRAARAARGHDHEVWSFALLLETLTPSANVRLGVPTALSPDLTMLTPEERVLSPGEASCRDLDRILPRLRDAGVARVLSAGPLDHPSLVLEDAFAPARTAPLAVRVYALANPLPWLELEGPGAVGRVLEPARGAGRVEAVVDTPVPSTLRVREGWAPGWSASVDGVPAGPRRTADGRLALAVPAGRSRVLLRYRPRGLRSALPASALAAALVAVLLARRAPPASPGPSPIC